MSSERFEPSGSENARAEQISHPPKATVYCHGTPMFRSRAARDIGCLLDVDPDVQAWECQRLELRVGNRHHAPDFLVTYIGGVQWLLDASDEQETPQSPKPQRVKATGTVSFRVKKEKSAFGSETLATCCGMETTDALSVIASG